MTRVEFSRKTRAAAFERCRGFCENCAAKLKAGGPEYDHIIPASLGGEASLSNCQVLCRPCHKTKTADDIRSIRKSDRQRDRQTGAIRPAGKLRGAPFPKSDKPKKTIVYRPCTFYREESR